MNDIAAQPRTEPSPQALLWERLHAGGSWDDLTADEKIEAKAATDRWKRKMAARHIEAGRRSPRNWVDRLDEEIRRLADILGVYGPLTECQLDRLYSEEWTDDRLPYQALSEMRKHEM